MIMNRIGKNILAIALFVFSSVMVCAQEVENPVGRFSLIPRVGVSIANLSNQSFQLMGSDQILKPKSQAGFLGGLDVEFRATEYLGVSLGAYYARQGCRWADYEERMDVNSARSNEEGRYFGYKNKHLNLDYINVPLMLKAYVAPRFAVMAGAQVGFLCGDGKVKEEVTPLTKDKNGSTWYEDSQDTEYSYPAKKVAVSIPVGLSYEYMNVVLDARYNIGLTKANKEGAADSKNRVFAFTVGYRFTM